MKLSAGIIYLGSVCTVLVETPNLTLWCAYHIFHLWRDLLWTCTWVIQHGRNYSTTFSQFGHAQKEHDLFFRPKIWLYDQPSAAIISVWHILLCSSFVAGFMRRMTGDCSSGIRHLASPAEISVRQTSRFNFERSRRRRRQAAALVTCGWVAQLVVVLCKPRVDRPRLQACMWLLHRQT